jgi:hypothetical protein
VFSDAGKLNFGGSTNSNNLSLLWDFETSAGHQVGVSSLTSVISIAFSSINLIAPFFQTSTAPTANSTGTVAIVAKDASLLTNNAGWLPMKKSDGVTVYIPYWT